MPTTIFGLPTHILVIHTVVVGIPLAALATAAIAVRTSWRVKLGVWVLGLDVLVTIGTFLARESGIDLYNALSPVVQQNAAHHKALGLTLIWFVLALLVVAAGLVAADRLGNKWLTGALTVATLVACVLSVVRVIQVGDAGAHAVWNGVVQSK
jgi:hypothetical protein